MANLASLLKTEITRLARKEIRLEIESLKKASSAFRSDIAALKKQVRELQGQLKRAQKHVGTVPNASLEPVGELRFRPSGMKAHRAKLGLSAKDYGLLVGASALSIYKWEDGKAKPRANALVKIAAVRDMGKREAMRKLDELRTD